MSFGALPTSSMPGRASLDGLFRVDIGDGLRGIGAGICEERQERGQVYFMAWGETPSRHVLNVCYAVRI